MTQEEWDNASQEEQEAEIERCKDPVYMYNTYWRREGMPEITAEQFEIMKQKALDLRIKPRRRTCKNPLDPDQYYKKIV